MVADVARHRAAIAATGTPVAFVHMHSASMADAYFAEFGLRSALQVSDPEQRLYAAFGLTRVSPTHWLSWKVIRRYIDAIFRGGHRPGFVGGDVLQMPGAFLVSRGAILRAFRPALVSERFDVVGFLNAEQLNAEQLDAPDRAG
jgi:AhpC/TSA antioxidant enzyme